eukprot:TRINITY_DN6590_c0_g1_i2.p1 TRINITY_DN6590_c0_g1~~TRINITY_DN6590_c0_g1_i2.p1  ORF type:complete len:429 (+),score=74.55 TRINITY_DN6590_c0_g1_i2:363-1649(+)
MLPPEYEYTSPQRVCDGCLGKLKTQVKPKEDAKLAVQYYLREELEWELYKPLFDIGSRNLPVKCFSSLKRSDKKSPDQYVLAMVSNRNSFINNENKKKIFEQLLTETLKHPYVLPAIKATYNRENSTSYVIREYSVKGSMKDRIYGRAEPQDPYDMKYGSKEGKGLGSKLLPRVGRMILEGLQYLHFHGFPYHHLHTGNILIFDNVVRLSDLENSLLGLDPYLSEFLKVAPKKIAPELICFGHVLFEMTLGFPKGETDITEIKSKCEPSVYEVLEMIFGYQDSRSTPPPTVKSLLKLKLFSSVEIDCNFEREKWDKKFSSLLKPIRQTLNGTPLSSTTKSMSQLPTLTGTLPKSVSLESNKPFLSPKITTKTTSNALPSTPPASPPPPPPPPKEVVDTSLPKTQTARPDLLSSLRNPDNLKKLKKVSK